MQSIKTLHMFQKIYSMKAYLLSIFEMTDAKASQLLGKKKQELLDKAKAVGAVKKDGDRYIFKHDPTGK